MTTLEEGLPITGARTLVRWFEDHAELIGEGSAIENAVRLLDWAYVGGCADPQRLPAAALKARGRRGDDPAARAADAIADLADTLNGFRTFFDREDERLRAERDEDRQREAVEWQDALNDLRSMLRGAIHMHGNGGAQSPGDRATSDEDALADYITGEIDRRLRDGVWSARRTFRLLGGEPPKDLRTEAEKWATAQYGPIATDERRAAVQAYLAGAGVGQ